jgi:hypothetical protein
MAYEMSKMKGKRPEPAMKKGAGESMKKMAPAAKKMVAKKTMTKKKM